MKVFISWSGNDSKQVAELLGEWIENVLQDVKAWISTDDIEKGSIWMTDISRQLKETRFGILCLTRENVDAPWILFEAGALSKGLSKSRVCPLLVNFLHRELKPPLANFNATLPVRDEMLKLIRAINAQRGAKKLADNRIESAFNVWWKNFEDKFAAIVKSLKPLKTAKPRPVEDMVAEILELTRSIQQNVQEQNFSLSQLSTDQDDEGRFIFEQIEKTRKRGAKHLNPELDLSALADELVDDAANQIHFGKKTT